MRRRLIYSSFLEHDTMQTGTWVIWHCVHLQGSPRTLFLKYSKDVAKTLLKNVSVGEAPVQSQAWMWEQMC